eukprot:8872787-Alexandrium_andersonii.AAC.1
MGGPLTRLARKAIISPKGRSAAGASRLLAEQYTPTHALIPTSARYICCRPDCIFLNYRPMTFG